MIEELRKFILFDYAAKKKNIDENFYNGIANIYSKYYGLGQYFNGMEYKSVEIGNAPAAYNNETNRIRIDMPNMVGLLKQACRHIPRNFNTTENEVFAYFFVARLMLHELTHATQMMDRRAEIFEMVPEGKRRILTQVDPGAAENYIYSCFANGTQKGDSRLSSWYKYVEKKFGYNLMLERDAEIQAHSIMYSMLKSYENRFPHLKEYIEANVYIATVMGYDASENGEIESPLYKYAKALRVNNMIPSGNVPWYNENMELSLKNACTQIPKTTERFRMGFPVTKDEFIRMKAKLAEFNQKGYLIQVYGTQEDFRKLEEKARMD